MSVDVRGQDTATPNHALGTTRRYVALVVVGVAILQALWIAVVPPFRASDEFDHAYRASAVAGGQWRTTEQPDDGRGLLVEASEPLVRAAHDQCAALEYTGPDNCTPVRDAGDGRVAIASGAANYNPAFYWVIGTAGEWFSGAGSLYAMRVASALLCLLFVGLGAWSVAAGRASPWSRIGVVFALSPVMLFSMSVAAPNGPEMAAAFAFWCAALTLGSARSIRTERVVLAIAVLAACVLVTTRLLGPLFALGILLTAWAANPSLVSGVWRRHRWPFVIGSVLVLACVSLATAWVLTTGSMNAAPERQGGGWHWNSLVLWPLQSIAAFPYRNQPGPMIIYPIVLLGFGLLVGAAIRLGARRERLVLVLTVVASLAIPAVITAATYSGRGAMWQGRYGLPYALGIVLLASVVLDRRLPSSRWRTPTVLVGAAAMAVGTAACLLRTLSRELDTGVSAGDPAWHAPSSALVVLLSVLAWGLFAAAALQGRRVPD